jgi:hypothetical protein
MVGGSSRGANTYWDFEEHTTGNGVYNGNTTRVDGFRLPIAIRLHCADGHDTTLGEDYFVFYQPRQSRFDEFINEATPEFTHLATAPYAPYVVSAPRGDAGFVSGKYKDYYTSYVNQIWTLNLRNKFAKFAKPTTDNVFSCTGDACGGNADIAAVLNRHVAEDTTKWDERKDGSVYYQKTPCNYYSRFMHRRSMKQRCYGFPYDDWAFWAAYDSHGGAQWLEIAVGF